MEGDNIGKLLLIEFADNENTFFNDIMSMLQKYPDFCKYKLKNEVLLSLPGLEIWPEHRKIYSGTQEISLTGKEFGILYLLAVNRGRVVTYEQIYQNVWNEYSTGGESAVIVYHIRNIRKKLDGIPSLFIQCIRELGYCMEVKKEESTGII